MRAATEAYADLSRVNHQPHAIIAKRRIFAASAGSDAVQPHHVEAVLNHHGGHRAGVAGVYNRSPYAAQIKAALARWAEHVAALVESRASNVIALQARG
jgi:hypothetical protein